MVSPHTLNCSVFPSISIARANIPSAPDFILPEDAFEAIQSLEKHQRMNFPARLGVDIFGEVGEVSARESALAWAAEQKKLAGH